MGLGGEYGRGNVKKYGRGGHFNNTRRGGGCIRKIREGDVNEIWEGRMLIKCGRGDVKKYGRGGDVNKIWEGC